MLHGEEYPRPDFNQMIKITTRLLDEYNITFEDRSMVFVDGTNPFFTQHKNMLVHAKEMLEYKNGQVAIHPKFNKLITALRTAEVTLNLASKIFGRSNNVISPILH